MRLLSTACCVVCLSVAAHGAVITLPTHLGPTNFDSQNFPNVLVGGSFSSTALAFGAGGVLVFGPLTTAQATPFVVGSDISTGVGLGAGPAGGVPDFLIPGFGLMSIVNGTGPDLVVFEAGSPAEDFRLGISLNGGLTFGANITYSTSPSVPLDTSSGFNTNTAFVDLSDFGVLAGQRVDALRLEGLFTGIGGSGPDILAIGVLNAGTPTGNVPGVPEPSTYLLLGSGLLAFFIRRRTA